MPSYPIRERRLPGTGAGAEFASDVINAAELHIAEFGPDALTIRDISIATGYSCIRIRNHFGSGAALIGRTWLRAARRFLTLLTSLVDETPGDPREKVCAAAEAPLLYPRQYPRSAALLSAARRDAILRRPMPAEVFCQLGDVEAEMSALMQYLSRLAWNRDDSEAVAAMSACVIGMSERIVTRCDGGYIYSVREYLRAVVQDVVDSGPPPSPGGRGSRACCPGHTL